MTTTRRTLLTGAAWSAPVIAFAVAVPETSASQVKCVKQTSSGPQDNGNYTVDEGYITVHYNHAPDIYEIQVRGPWGQKNFGTNFGSAPEKGTKKWTVEIPGCPSWVKVHSFNLEYGTPSFPIKKG